MRQPVITTRTPIGCILALLVVLFAGRAFAAVMPDLPEGFVYERVISITQGYPTSIAFGAPDRMFIALKSGLVLQSRGEWDASNIFLDLRPEVNDRSDRGLLGVAVHPDFPSPPWLYLLYVYDPPELPGSPGDVDGTDGKGARVSRLIRVTADAATDYETELPGSRVVLLGTASTLENIGDPTGEFGPPSCAEGGSPDSAGTAIEDCIPSDGPSHSVGTLTFGTDGSLFVGHGDGARWVNVDPRALRTLDLDSLAGKVLRIDPSTGAGLADNPFFDGDPSHNRSKVWGYGLRNPFRSAVEPETGQLWIGDVGWELWEELDTGAGGNFGWPCYEGGPEGNLRQPAFEADPKTRDRCAELYALEPDEVTPPVYSYGRNQMESSINAGAFYSGSSYPEELHDALFLADYNRQSVHVGKVNHGDLAASHADDSIDVSLFATGMGGLVQIISGPDSNLYFVMLGVDNEIRRLRYVGGGNHVPVAVASASPTEGFPPLSVSFSSQRSYDADAEELAFHWDFGDGQESFEANPTHVFTEEGIFDVRLEATDGADATGVDSVRIVVGNTAPVATIELPAVGKTYRIGDAIDLQGSAVDFQDGEIGEGDLHWEVILHHNDHQHPSYFASTGSSAQFVIDDHGDGTWLDVQLIAEDSTGLEGMASLQLYPQTAAVTLQTIPEGLEIIYEGKEATTPFEVTSIVDGVRQIIAPDVQHGLSFDGWVDGSERVRQIVVPAEGRSLTATYRNHLPSAVAVAQPEGSEFPLRVRFDGSESFDREDQSLEYEWDFADGSAVERGAEVTHTFVAEGRYRVRLTVRDSRNGEAVAFVSVGDPADRRRGVARPH